MAQFRPIVNARKFRNISRSCTIGVDPDEKVGGAASWDLTKAQVTIGGHPVFLPPGAIWHDDDGNKSNLCNGQVFVRCSDPTELKELVVKHGIQVFDIPKNAPVDHPELEALRKMMPAAAQIAQITGLRGFFGPGVILEDVTVEYGRSVQNHVNLLAAQGHIDELRQKASLVDEAQKMKASLEAERAAMLSELEKMKAEMALMKAQASSGKEKRG